MYRDPLFFSLPLPPPPPPHELLYSLDKFSRVQSRNLTLLPRQFLPSSLTEGSMGCERPAGLVR